LSKYVNKLGFSRKRAKKRGRCKNNALDMLTNIFIDKFDQSKAANTKFVCIDECGFSENLRPLYGYSKKGEPLTIHTYGGWTHYSLLMAVFQCGKLNFSIKKGSINKEKVYSDERFVGPMLDYIVKDFERTKIVLNDNSIGGMIVCDSYEQAKEMFQIFNNKYKKDSDATDDKKVNSAALILFDEGTKKDRRKNIDDFKNGKIDFLFVFNMLLTGFDSPRLKKIYLGRKIKSHNLLQALTRVNRPYKNLRYGYVVDFANIEEDGIKEKEFSQLLKSEPIYTLNQFKNY
jgi:hypothetical protein